MSTICVCAHCGSYLKGSGKYCSDCNTAEGRRKMDEANRLNFEGHKLSAYECQVCKKEKEDRERKKEQDKLYNNIN